MGAKLTLAEKNFVTGSAGVSPLTSTGTWSTPGTTAATSTTSSTCSLGASNTGFSMIEAVFPVQNSVGLAVHSPSPGNLVNGVFFTINYIGSETQFILENRSNTSSLKANNVVQGYAEGPMPSWMSRGGTYTWRLGSTTLGFYLLAQHVVSGDWIPILALQLQSTAGASTTPRTPPFDTTYGPNRGHSYFFSQALGATVNRVKVLTTGTYGDIYGLSSGVLLWGDLFDRAPAATYLPSQATFPTGSLSGPECPVQSGGTPTGLGLDFNNYLVLAVTTTAQTLFAAVTANQPESEHPCYAIQVSDFYTNPVALKLSYGNIREVHFNSTVSGSFRAVTVVTNGTL